MPTLKFVDSTALDGALTATANAIRAKTGSQESIVWDASDGFSDAVEDIQAGGNNQTKTGIVPTESSQTITYDNGYDGLESVQINGISPSYIGSGVARKSAQTYTPGISNQVISSGQYLTGDQTVASDQNLVAANIKNGVSIFSVTGNYSPSVSMSTVQTNSYTTSSSLSTYSVTYTFTPTIPEGYTTDNLYIQTVYCSTSVSAVELESYSITSDGKVQMDIRFRGTGTFNPRSKVIKTMYVFIK